MRKVSDYFVEEELELYKAIIEVQPESLFLMDKDKNLIGIFNASPKTLAGYTVDEIVGNSILKYANDTSSIFYQACSILNSTFDIVYKTGVSRKFQYMILDTYFEATISKISNNRILSQVRDITDIVLELKDVEQKKRNELAIALIAGGLTSWSYDVEKCIISSSHENNVIVGDMSLDELLSLIVPQHRSETVQIFENIIERKSKHEHVTVKVLNNQGLMQWSDVHAVPHEYSPDGKVKLIIGSQKDVTKEYEYHEKLKMLNKQNGLILNNTNSGFAYLTSDLKVEWENISKIFFDPEVSGLFYEGNQIVIDKEKHNIDCISAILEAVETKKQVITKDKLSGGIIIESIIQPVFSDDNEFEGIVIRIDDITEKEYSVHELAKAKEKAEQSDKLKTAFLANMSHEIRTPLNSIVGFSQLLSDIESPEERLSYINIINSNTQVLLNLINDILDLSKIEAGYFNCNDAVFNLCELYSELEVSFKNRVRAGVSFVCDLPENYFYVKLDRMRVSQIISNFITNSIKFTWKGHIKIGFIAVNNCVKIYVEDTGCGMSKEQMKHVFDRFEKFDSFEQGTGLGTSIAKAIVDVYGGEIGVMSDLGVGSTFWAVLPTNMDSDHLVHDLPRKDIVTNKKPNEKDFSNFRILIAEDNDSNYKLVEILLKNYPIKRAFNGQEALEMVKKENFDIILMDIRMPQMDGIEATQSIREFNATIPIIALTANAFDDDKRKALEAGANDFLTKPLHKELLISTIKQYLK